VSGKAGGEPFMGSEELIKCCGIGTGATPSGQAFVDDLG
jgi:hypothetical protein